MYFIRLNPTFQNVVYLQEFIRVKKYDSNKQHLLSPLSIRPQHQYNFLIAIFNIPYEPNIIGLFDNLNQAKYYKNNPNVKFLVVPRFDKICSLIAHANEHISYKPQDKFLSSFIKSNKFFTRNLNAY